MIDGIRVLYTYTNPSPILALWALLAVAGIEIENVKEASHASD